MYTARRGVSWADAQIVIRRLRTGEHSVIIDGGTYPRFASDEQLLFARGDVLFSAELDADALTLRRAPQLILEGVLMDPRFGGAAYGLARDGTLVYVPGDARGPLRTLLWVDAGGIEQPAFPEERPFLMPAISPDGGSVAITIEGMQQDIWRFEMGDTVLRRLTTAHAENFGPVWSPDGGRLAFVSIRPGERPAVFVKPSDRSDSETVVIRGPDAQFPNAWTRDGQMLLVTAEPSEGRRPALIVTVPASGGPADSLLSYPYARYAAAMSPDGERIAFVSNETGRPEVFVASYPDPSDMRQVSPNGGTSPVWARDGRQLFFRNGDAVVAVGFGSSSSGPPASARLLFRGRFEEPARPDWPRNYDVGPDGRFLMIRDISTSPQEIIVVEGWRPGTPSSH